MSRPGVAMTMSGNWRRAASCDFMSSPPTYSARITYTIDMSPSHLTVQSLAHSLNDCILGLNLSQTS